MKRKIQLLFFGIVLLCAGYPYASNAQITFCYCLSEPDFLITYKNISKYAVLDSSYLNLVYRYNFKESANDNECSGEDEMNLSIGKKYTTFYSKNLHELDKKCTELSKKQLTNDVSQADWQGYEILRDLSNNTLVVNNRVPFTDNVSQYEEDIPTMKWNPIAGEDTVMGYKCKKATTDFGGRSYVAWFCPDIPVSYGPWKFGGLPGLILKIKDTENNFVFKCIGLDQKPLPIVKYDWKYKETTKKDWQTFEKNMYEHAGKFVQSTGTNVIIADHSEKGYHSLEDTWVAYYNPIEKE